MRDGELPFAVDNLRFFAASARFAARHGGGRVQHRLHVHAHPPARRHGGRDHAVELPVHHGRVEGRRGAGRRMHRGAQARTDHASLIHPARRTRARGRAPDRRASRWSPATPRWARRWSPTRRRHDHGHRLDRHRPAHHGARRRPPQAGAPRARRQGAASWCSTTPTSRPSAGAAALAATYNSGQDCTAATRVYVQRGGARPAGRRHRRHDGRRSASATRSTRPPTSARSSRQPTATASPASSTRASADGARVVAGGTALDRAGFFFRPTLVTGADQTVELVQDEIFGPVLAVVPFDDEADAIAQGQRHAYGLASSVWTSARRPRPARRPPAAGRRHLGERPPAHRQRDAPRRAWRVGLRQGHGPRRRARLHPRPSRDGQAQGARGTHRLPPRLTSAFGTSALGTR